MSRKRYYEILGLSEDATETELRDALNEATKEFHPDHSDAPDASERAADINTIRDVLLNRRRAYDAATSHSAYVSRNPSDELICSWDARTDSSTDSSENESKRSRNDEFSEEPSDSSSRFQQEHSHNPDPTDHHKDRANQRESWDESRTTEDTRQRDSRTHDREEHQRRTEERSDGQDQHQRPPSDDEIDPRFDDPSSYPGEYPPDWEARRKRVYIRDNFQCANCGHQSGPHADGNGRVLHAHHIVPLSKGGTNALTNLQALCDRCHQRIHDHDLDATEESSYTNDTASPDPVSGGGGSESQSGGPAVLIGLALPLYVFSLEWIFNSLAGGGFVLGTFGVVYCCSLIYWMCNNIRLGSLITGGWTVLMTFGWYIGDDTNSMLVLADIVFLLVVPIAAAIGINEILQRYGHKREAIGSWKETLFN